MVFTEADLKGIVRNLSIHASTQSTLRHPQRPPALELVSGGLVLEYHARSMIARIILQDKQTARITLLELGTLTNIKVKNIETLLPPDEEEWGRVGISTIVRKSEFVMLKNDLSEKLSSNVLIVSDYCQSKAIDLILLRKLLRSITTDSSDVQWLGHDRDMVCKTSFYTECQESLLKTLQEITRPVDISTFLPERSLPIEFISRLLASTLKGMNEPLGKLKGTTYTPRVYDEERKNALIETLQKKNIIDLDSLTQEGIKHPETFVKSRLPNVHFLKNHIVTDVYLSQLDENVRGKLQRDGWADVKDTEQKLSPGDEKILRQMIRGNRRGDTEEHASVFVAKSLRACLTGKASEFASQQAQATQVTTIKWQELLTHLSGTTSVPISVLTSLLTTIHPIAVSKFTEHVTRLRESTINTAKEAFTDKCVSRFMLHHTALKGIPDEPLRSKLGTDLVEYSRELIIGHVDKLENTVTSCDEEFNIGPFNDVRKAFQLSAKAGKKPEFALKEIEQCLASFQKQMGMAIPSGELLALKKGEMLNDLRAQLQKTKDASLGLTVVLIVIHASLTPGVLKASGKYVPKLLKLLQGRIDSGRFEHLVRTKEAVIARSKVSEEDFARLREMAQESRDN